MKKTYITPKTNFICLDPVESMMTVTGSQGGLDGTSNGGTTDGNNITGGDSNRRSIWSED